VDVAETAAATAGDHDLLANPHEVGDQLARGKVDDTRARRDREVQVVTRLAMPLGALATATRGCREVVLVAEVVECGLPGIDAKVHGAASTTVAAVRPAPRNVGLASHRGRAIAAGTGAH
jgi:hypothetical protein